MTLLKMGLRGIMKLFFNRAALFPEARISESEVKRRNERNHQNG